MSISEGQLGLEERSVKVIKLRTRPLLSTRSLKFNSLMDVVQRLYQEKYKESTSRRRDSEGCF